jgi:hypothetical protein
MFDDCYAAYRYGSRVYGTATIESDWDYIVVKEGAGDGEMSVGNIDYKCMSPAKFQELLDEHNISALECLFIPDEHIIVAPPVPWKFKLDKKKLRASISAKSNHSWVKAKKKFASPYDWAEGERHRGKKSLYHSMRIISFGIQIAAYGKITKYDILHDPFMDIMTDPSVEWDNYQKKWKPMYNNIMTKFRALAPKG